MLSRSLDARRRRETIGHRGVGENQCSYTFRPLPASPNSSAMARACSMPLLLNTPEQPRPAGLI